MQHINAAYQKVHSNQLCHPLRSASWEVNQGQVIRWMTMPVMPITLNDDDDRHGTVNISRIPSGAAGMAAPDGILEMLTVLWL
jgi:hypothetical protein